MKVRERERVVILQNFVNNGIHNILADLLVKAFSCRDYLKINNNDV